MEKIKKLDMKSLLNVDVSTLFKKEKKIVEKKQRKPLINKKVISVDIGSQNIKIVVGKMQKDKLVVEEAFRFKPMVRVYNDNGIEDSTSLAREIELIINNKHIKTKYKDTNCTSNNTTIINREIVVPVAEASELDTLVKFEMQRYLPINMEDYVVQYDILEKLNVDGMDKYRILVFIYPIKLSKAYFELLNKAKLKPNALDMNPNCINKLIKQRAIIDNTEYDPQSTVAVIDMGAETLEVNIYNGENLEFTRIIKSGGKDIDFGISKLLGISKEQSEIRKINEANLLEEDINEVSKSVKFDVDDWIVEIGKILQFFRNKKVGNKIDKVLIHGGSSKITGLESYLEKGLNLPVKKINTISNVEINNGVNQEDIDMYLNAIGAIIRL